MNCWFLLPLPLLWALCADVALPGEERPEAGAERISAWEKKAAEVKDPVLVWIEATKDKGEAVRLEAANQLRDADDPRAIPALEELASARPKMLDRGGPLYPFDQVAKIGLQKIRARVEWEKIVKENPDVRARLQAAKKAFQTDNPFLRSRIRDFVVELWSEDANTLLLSADDYDAKICAAMAEHIKVGRQFYQNALKALKQAEGPFAGTAEEAQVRRKSLWSALVTFRCLGDVDCVPALLKVLVLDEKIDPDCDLRMQVRQTIASFGEAALPSLEEFLKKEGTKPEERANAVTTVRLIGGRRALEIVKGAVSRESDPEIRKSMQKLLDLMSGQK